MKYAWLGIAFIALATVSTVYAERGFVGFPEISDSNMIGQDVQVTYQTDNRWTITVTTQFQVDKVIELPETIYYPGIDGQIYSIDLKEGFILANSGAQYNSADAPDVEELSVGEAGIEKKKQEIQEEQDDVWGKYKTCMIEFEEEQPVRFEAWQRTATLTEFEIPDETIAYGTANYSNEELKAERAWQVCEGIKNYPWIGVYEKNKSMDTR